MCIFAHKETLKKYGLSPQVGGGFPPKSNVPVFFFTFTKSKVPSFHDICHNWYSKK